jgi:hypothetical protein
LISVLKRISWTVVAGSLPVLALSYCYDEATKEVARKAQEKAEEQKELATLLNKETMAGEIDRRLKDNITLIPPFIVIHNLFGSFAIPEKSGWTIECGPFSGLKIKFGDAARDTVLTTSFYEGSLPTTACDALIGSTVDRYLRYTQGHSSPPG